MSLQSRLRRREAARPDVQAQSGAGAGAGAKARTTRPAALGLAVLTALTAFTTLGPAATPAQAAPEDCPKGYFCGWTSPHATGPMFKTNKSVSSLGSWDGQIQSVVNRSTLWACTYDEPGYLTSEWSMGTRAPSPTAEDWGGPGVGSLSSIKLVPTERECYGPAYPDWSAEPTPDKRSSFANLNGDYTADLLARDKVGRLWFLPGNGTGKLVGGGWQAMNALTRHGDFTGDGKEDVIAREASTGRLWLYPGTGTGSLGARTLIGTGGWNSLTRITAFGDMTGDNRSDLLAVEKSTGKLWLYPGTGTSSGKLGARKLIGTGGWTSMDALTATGDVTGDGRADLLARQPATGQLWLYRGKSGGLGTRTLLGGGWNAMSSLVATGDHGLDGLNDFAGLTNSRFRSPECSYEGCLMLYQGTGNGTFRGGYWDTRDHGWNDMSTVF
ncbi:FG-GAP-like repeat-containing protein [Streptomyces sp. NPDC012421]|uniref:FG-GAP-like repeat-containing protein n=1 Tax=Streptomyces sp. NPDC012421 TaxID=3364832 RepID=UPI0036E5CEB5